jgi:hypothetical protein
MNDVCEKIEAFFQQLEASGEVEVYDDSLEPSSEEDIAALEQGLGAKLPADVRAWLTRGCKAYTGSIDEPFAGIGFAFLGASRSLEHTKMLRENASDDEADEHATIIRAGVALSFEEPELVVTPDGVYSFSFRNPVLKVAGSWREFLESWLASGAFSSHDFDAAWAKTAPFVPQGSVAPEQNAWVQAYRSLHNESD